MSIVDSAYFDYASTAPPYPEAIAMFSEISHKYFANPSSLHKHGTASRFKLEELKKMVSELIGFNDGRLLLCSSGTEANNTIIEGHFKAHPKARILTAINTHDSIWYARKLYKNQTDILPVNNEGISEPQMLIKSIKKGTSLVCISHVCSETGAIQPVKELASVCSDRGIKLLIDGVQAVGHLPLNLDDIHFDYYVFSSHKFGSVKGTGGILIRNSEFDSLMHGGKQEYNLRAGTENVAGLAATVEALKISIAQISEEQTRLRNLTDLLINELRQKNVNMLINSPVDSLPGFISLSFPGFMSAEIVTALSLSGFAVSAGSACHSGVHEPSRTITAMGRSKKEALGSIRITMGRYTTSESVIQLACALNDFVNL